MVIFSTTALGFMYGDRLKKRTKQLKEIRRCIYEIENHILYTHTALPKAIEFASSKVIEPVSTLFLDIFYMLSRNKVDNVYQAFKYAFLNKKDIINLKDEDINIILDFSKSLGESDIEGQKAIFSLVSENLKNQIDSSELMLKKNIKMYRCLGFSLGAMVIILLI